jgi:hypothetical protein
VHSGLVDSYQKRVEKIGKELNDCGKAVGQIAGTLSAVDDQEEKRQILTGLLKTLKPYTNLLSIAVDELQSEINGLRSLGKLQGQIDYLREHSTIDLEAASPEELEQHIHLMFESVAIINMLNQAILTTKCENLFGEYVGTAMVRQ